MLTCDACLFPCRTVRNEIAKLRSGKMDDQLPAMYAQVLRYVSSACAHVQELVFCAFQRF